MPAPIGPSEPARPPVLTTPSPYTDEAGLWFGAENEWGISYKFHTYYGRSLMPVAGAVESKTPPACVDLNEPYTVLTIEWTAESMGSPPALPMIDTGDEDDTILEAIVNPHLPQTVGDSAVYRVSGVYIYVKAKVLNPGDELPVLGKNPRRTREANDKNKIKKENWTPVLLLGKKSNNFDNGLLSGGGNSQG